MERNNCISEQRFFLFFNWNKYDKKQNKTRLLNLSSYFHKLIKILSKRTKLFTHLNDSQEFCSRMRIYHCAVGAHCVTHSVMDCVSGEFGTMKWSWCTLCDTQCDTKWDAQWALLLVILSLFIAVQQDNHFWAKIV